MNLEPLMKYMFCDMAITISSVVYLFALIGLAVENYFFGIAFTIIAIVGMFGFGIAKFVYAYKMWKAIKNDK